MLIPAPHIHHATAEHGTAVLDARSGQWLMLDPDASRIWHTLTVRVGLTGLADEIAITTGQDPGEVEQQITLFLDALVESGVLVDTDRPQQRRRWWRR